MAQVTGIRRNLYDRCIHLDNLIDGSFMRSVWRKHLIICLFLGPMAVPMYLLDRAFLGGGGSNWGMTPPVSIDSVPPCGPIGLLVSADWLLPLP